MSRVPDLDESVEAAPISAAQRETEHRETLEKWLVPRPQTRGHPLDPRIIMRNCLILHQPLPTKSQPNPKDYQVVDITTYCHNGFHGLTLHQWNETHKFTPDPNPRVECDTCFQGLASVLRYVHPLGRYRRTTRIDGRLCAAIESNGVYWSLCGEGIAMWRSDWINGIKGDVTCLACLVYLSEM